MGGRSQNFASRGLMYTTTMWAMMLGCLVVATGAMHMVNKPDSKVSSPSNPLNLATLGSNTCAAGCRACNVANAVTYSSGCQVATCVEGMGPSADKQSCEDLWELVWFTGQRTGSGDCFDYDTIKHSFQESLQRCRELGQDCRYIYDWGCHQLETAGVDCQPLSVLQSTEVADDNFRVCGTEATSDLSLEKVETNTPGTYHCALRRPVSGQGSAGQ